MGVTMVFMESNGYPKERTVWMGEQGVNVQFIDWWGQRLEFPEENDWEIFSESFFFAFFLFFGENAKM